MSLFEFLSILSFFKCPYHGVSFIFFFSSKRVDSILRPNSLFSSGLLIVICSCGPVFLVLKINLIIIHIVYIVSLEINNTWEQTSL